MVGHWSDCQRLPEVDGHAAVHQPAQDCVRPAGNRKHGESIIKLFLQKAGTLIPNHTLREKNSLFYNSLIYPFNSKNFTKMYTEE